MMKKKKSSKAHTIKRDREHNGREEKKKICLIDTNNTLKIKQNMNIDKLKVEIVRFVTMKV